MSAGHGAPRRAPCRRTPTRSCRRGRSTSPWCRRRRAVPETTLRSVGWGLFLCVIFTVASAYSGPEGRAGDGGGDPDLDPGDRPGARVRRRSSLLENVIISGIGGTSGAWWRAPSSRCRRSTPAAEPAPGADGVHLPGRRLPRRAVPHPAAPLLRARDARRVPVPGGHGDHRGARHRREGRLAGEAAAAGDGDRGRLRLLRDHLPGVEGVHRLPVRAGGEDAGREGEGGHQLRRRRLHPGPRLRHGPALVDDPRRGRRALELRARAAHLDDRPAPARRWSSRRAPSRSRR